MTNRRSSRETTKVEDEKTYRKLRKRMEEKSSEKQETKGKVRKKKHQHFRSLTVDWDENGLYRSAGCMLESVTCVTAGSWKTTNITRFILDLYTYVYNKEFSFNFF